MRLAILTTFMAAVLAVCAHPAAAQTTKPATPEKDYANSRLVTHMMAFDKKGDGKLTRDEITDPRLVRLFDEADANHDGVVTREELIALAARLDAELPPQDERFRPGGPGGPGMRYVTGQILPPGMEDLLNLTPAQRERIRALEQEAREKLGKILTAEQMKQLESGPPRGRRDGPPPSDR